MTQTTSFGYQKFKDEKEDSKDKDSEKSGGDTQQKNNDGCSAGGASVIANTMADETPLEQTTHVVTPDTVQMVIKDNDTPAQNNKVITPTANGHVTMDLEAANVVIEEKWSWITLIMSVVSIFFCSICGVFATVVAILAYIDHKVKDHERSQRKRNVALILSVIGIILGILCLLVLLILLAVMRG